MCDFLILNFQNKPILLEFQDKFYFLDIQCVFKIFKYKKMQSKISKKLSSIEKFLFPILFFTKLKVVTPSKFDLFPESLTLSDLRWPRAQFPWKAELLSAISNSLFELWPRIHNVYSRNFSKVLLIILKKTSTFMVNFRVK